MGIFFDLHRHDEYSLFDGFGSPSDIARKAKELGYPALGISNHGSISGLIKHWKACEENNIKPVLGCEVYFQPKFKRERNSYHLCLFVKNYEGYKNLCHMLSEANKEQFYYKAIIDFKLLEKYADGLICTTACINGAISQAIKHGNIETAEKLLKKFKAIFGKDLYVEIQPYSIDKEHTQEKVDYQAMKLARKNKVKCILTSDSHYGSKEDFDTYLKMHEISSHSLDWVKDTYSERYMPSEIEIAERFAKMYKGKFKDSMSVAERFIDNMKGLLNSIDDDIMGKLKLHLPKISNNEEYDSHKMLKQMVRKGLQKKKKWTEEYKNRCLEELDVIHYHGFDDYFLMVQDYVNWAKRNDIEVGVGRGSVCNCLVAYALDITDVDSIRYKLDFSRFMRKDKKSLPDIDVDFETDKRQQVIEYLIHKYEGKAVQICSYGEYSVDNLVNDLAPVCGLPTSGKEIDEWEKAENKKVVDRIKAHIKDFIFDGKLNRDRLEESDLTGEYNERHDNIIKHFLKLYKKIRYFGTHAAGVAIVGTDISDYTALVRKGDTFNSCYDKDDLEHINCVKFDMLGLKTLSELKELRELSGNKVTDKNREENAIYENFCEGKTDGVFQMEKSAPKKILNMIQCDCVEDVIAVNALNRPAPLQLKMHETYAYNKLSGEVDTHTPFYQYTKETYGTMLYQEQTVEVAQKLGHLTSQQSFDLLKIMKKAENLNKPEYIPVIEQMKKDFYKGAESEGLDEEQINSIWASMLIYGFNKGH